MESWDERAGLAGGPSAVRMVFDFEQDDVAQWGAIWLVAEQIGCPTEGLRRWVHECETDKRRRDGLSSSERVRLTDLEREVRVAREMAVREMREMREMEDCSRSSGSWPCSSSRRVRAADPSSRSAALTAMTGPGWPR
jgi:transposase-like protein